MGETKHTPGPWNLDDNVDVIGPDRDWIATVRVEHLTRPAEGPHNARLIAAAPDLLAACEAALAALNRNRPLQHHDDVKAHAQLRAAIAAARGER